MRWLRGVVFVAGALLAHAGAQVSDPALAALEHGRLVLWVVHPAAKTWSPEYAATNTAVGPQAISREIHEQTAGSFGAAASNVGTNASNYGQAPSTLGTNASDAGTASSNYGQTAASFGTEASNVGTTAGSYGQTASTYGQTSSTYGESISGVSNATGVKTNPAQRTQTTLQARYLRHQHLRDWDGLTGALKGEFSGLDIVLYDVREEDLSDALRLAANTQDAPDVLLGAPLPWKWAKLTGGAKTRLVLTAFGTKEGVAKRFNWGPEWAIVADAPHTDRARAFAIWMADGNVCASCGKAVPDANSAGAVALRAVSAVIQAGTVDGGDTDPEFARASAAKVRAIVLGDSGADKVIVNGDIVSMLGNDRFAAVAVRAMVSTPRTRTVAGAFGVVHALVLLRRESPTAKWRVLQISPEMSGDALTSAMGMLGESLHFESKPAVLGVSLAAPPDGDTRAARPDLWWDNKGGAALEMVEWQQGPSNSWSGARLMFLPDRTGEVKTRATAGFASEASAYRWRVWSVGDDGAVVLSDWRTMNIVP